MVCTVTGAYCRAVLALPETLARVETRIAAAPRDRTEFVDIRDLSRRTALRERKAPDRLAISEKGALAVMPAGLWSGDGEDEAVEAP